MRSNWLISGLVLTVALLSACAPATRLRPVSGELAKTQHFLGLFEISPPQGSDWYEIRRAQGVLAYGKKLEEPSHTFIASAHVSDAGRIFTNENDFLIYVKNARANNHNPDRFNVLFHDEKLDRTKAPYCTKFHLKAEDRVASKSSGSLRILEMSGFTCLHPRNPKIVTVEYSERADSPFQDATLVAEGERFINSLELK